MKSYFRAVLNLDPLENFVIAIGCGASLSGLTLLEAFVPSVECGHDVVWAELAGGRFTCPSCLAVGRVVILLISFVFWALVLTKDTYLLQINSLGTNLT